VKGVTRVISEAITRAAPPTEGRQLKTNDCVSLGLCA
jgi:hypothetical protein